VDERELHDEWTPPEFSAFQRMHEALEFDKPTPEQREAFARSVVASLGLVLGYHKDANGRHTIFIDLAERCVYVVGHGRTAEGAILDLAANLEKCRSG